MEYKIKYSSIAEESLINIFDYISVVLSNSIAARNTVEGIIATINSLKEFPKKYKLCEEAFLSERNIRSTKYKNYKILYYVDESEKIILINNIFFIKRDIKNVLNN